MGMSGMIAVERTTAIWRLEKREPARPRLPLFPSRHPFPCLHQCGDANEREDVRALFWLLGRGGVGEWKSESMRSLTIITQLDQ